MDDIVSASRNCTRGLRYSAPAPPGSWFVQPRPLPCTRPGQDAASQPRLFKSTGPPATARAVETGRGTLLGPSREELLPSVGAARVGEQGTHHEPENESREDGSSGGERHQAAACAEASPPLLSLGLHKLGKSLYFFA